MTKVWKSYKLCYLLNKKNYFKRSTKHFLCTGFRRPIYLDLFGPKWPSLHSLPFQGPKKVSIFRAHPFQWPSKWIFPHQNHYARYINNRYRVGTGTLIVKLSVPTGAGGGGYLPYKIVSVRAMDDDGSAEVIHEGILHKLDGRLQQTTNVFVI
jgi:hypothetical protein